MVSSVRFPAAAPTLCQEARGWGLRGAGRWCWGGKPAVPMHEQAFFLSAVTFGGCPNSRLEHCVLAALMKEQGYIWATPTSTPNISRKTLCQDLTVLAVRAPVSGLVHGQFWSVQWWLVLTIFKPGPSALLKFDADEFCQLALPSTPHFWAHTCGLPMQPWKHALHWSTESKLCWRVVNPVY